MAIKPTPLVRRRPALAVDSLHEAATVARRLAGPLKVTRRDERGIQELYFYRDLVIHAQSSGHGGVAAVRSMLASHRGPFTCEDGRWPARHTMLIEWSALLDEARKPVRRVARPVITPVARYRDESEATLPLGPRGA